MSIIGEVAAEFLAMVAGDVAAERTPFFVRRMIAFLALVLVWAFVAFFVLVGVSALVQGHPEGLLIFSAPGLLLGWVLVRERVKLRRSNANR